MIKWIKKFVIGVISVIFVVLLRIAVLYGLFRDELKKRIKASYQRH